MSPQSSSRGSSSAQLHQIGSRVSSGGDRPRSPSQTSRPSSFFFHPPSQSGSPRSRSKEISPETSPPSTRFSMPPSPSLLPHQISSSLDRSQSVMVTSSTTPKGAGRSQPPLRRLSNHLLPVKRLLGTDRETSSAPLSPSFGRASLDLLPGDRSLSSNALSGSRSRSPLPPTPQSPSVIRRTLTPDLQEKQPGKLARLFGRKKQSKEPREGAVDIPTSARSSEGRSSPMPGPSSYQSDASHVRASIDSEGPVVPGQSVVLGSLPRLEDEGGLGIHFQASSSDDHSSNNNHSHLSPRWPVGAHRYGDARPSTSSAEVSNGSGRRSYDLPPGETLDIADDLDFSDDDDAYDEDLGGIGSSAINRDAGGFPRTGRVDFSMGRDGFKTIGLGANGEDRFDSSPHAADLDSHYDDDRLEHLPRPTFTPSFTSPRDRTGSNQQSSLHSGTPSTIRPPRSALYNNTPSPSPSPPASPAYGRFASTAAYNEPTPASS